MSGSRDQRAFVHVLAVGLGALLAAGASAQGVRSSDERLSRDDLGMALEGNQIAFYDGSRAEYGSDGSYSYTYADGDPPFVGEWQLGEDGEVCVRFLDGFSRCDTYVRNEGRLVLIIMDGTRFPVREVEAFE